jgi:5-methylcytosine-specific restriction endonuclease McrA
MAKVCQYQDCTNNCYGDFCLRHKPRKRIRQQGKQAKLWNQVRNEWLIENGTYHDCYICGVKLNETTLTIDHVIPRSNAKNYANRHDPSNLRPACWTCNSLKGSKH